MMVDKLTYEVEPGLLFGRPGPNKSRWDLATFQRQGLVAIISLVANPASKEVEAAGLRHYFIPFEDKIHRPFKTKNPQVLQVLEEFDRVLQTHLPRKEPVLVHCNSGKDRTGLLLTYYLITRKGFNAKRAIREIRRLKPNALSAKGYEDFIYALEDWMIGRREVIAALDEESKQTVAAGPLEESSAAQEGRRAAPSPRPGTR